MVPGNTGSGGANSHTHSRPYFGPTEPHSGQRPAARLSAATWPSTSQQGRAGQAPVLC